MDAFRLKNYKGNARQKSDLIFLSEYYGTRSG